MTGRAVRWRGAGSRLPALRGHGRGGLNGECTGAVPAHAPARAGERCAAGPVPSGAGAACRKRSMQALHKRALSCVAVCGRIRAIHDGVFRRVRKGHEHRARSGLSRAPRRRAKWFCRLCRPQDLSRIRPGKAPSVCRLAEGVCPGAFQMQPEGAAASAQKGNAIFRITGTASRGYPGICSRGGRPGCAQRIVSGTSFAWFQVEKSV